MDKAVFFDKKYLLINWNKTWFDFFWVFLDCISFEKKIKDWMFDIPVEKNRRNL